MLGEKVGPVEAVSVGASNGTRDACVTLFSVATPTLFPSLFTFGSVRASHTISSELSPDMSSVSVSLLPTKAAVGSAEKFRGKS
jgi:hypothetical protein